ncbi:MAG TPA: hypothetical protein PKJ98_03010 [Verrucomicrobiota bacterium]|nr:hypothetical protein [Verrucomicrobiota bacterium]
MRIAMLLLGLSGAAALGHQVLWTRRLTDLIGAGVESSARVFECFFLGLALGAAVAAWTMPRVRRPWRVAAGAELGVAILSVPLLFLPAWAGWIGPALGVDRLLGWQGTAIRAALSVLTVVPPAFLLGLTLPLITEAVGDLEAWGLSGPVALYAAYTIGGALGLALVVGAALQRVGVQGSMLLMTGLSAIVALGCCCWDRFGRVGSGARARAGAIAVGEGETREGPVPLLLAMGSGFGVLALEVLGLALLNLKMPLAFYTPAAVLVCVVGVLGLAAVVAPYAARRFGGVAILLPCALAAAGLMAAVAPALFMAVTSGQAGIMVHGGGIAGSLIRLAAVAGVSLGPALALAGLVFPWLLGGGSAAAGGDSTGRRVGRLLALNGLGGMLGAETAVRVLLPLAGVHQALGVVGGFYALLSAVALLGLGRRRRVPILGLLLPSAGVALVFVGILQGMPVFLRTATFRVIDVRSGGEGSLAVVERADVGRAMFLDNLYLLGGSRAAVDLERQAHLPLLLHPAPRRVAFIGLGTGITAGGALRHEAVEAVDIAEVSALVADAAARHFREFNQGACDHPKARVHIADGGPYLAAAPERFDVIVGDLFIPWRPGEARLCSLEQFQAARGALRSQGLFCQWLPMAQLTEEDFNSIVTTFHRVFGTVHLFRAHFRTRSLPVALVGFKGGGIDWSLVSARCQAERGQGGLKDPACRHAEGLAMLYAGTWEGAERAVSALNTLGNLRVELHAGRHTLEGSPGDYYHADSDRWLDFLEQQVKAVEIHRQMPEGLRHLPRLGLWAARWEIAAEREEPSAPILGDAVAAGLPDALRRDLGADWALWPGRPPF